MPRWMNLKALCCALVTGAALSVTTPAMTNAAEPLKVTPAVVKSTTDPVAVDQVRWRRGGVYVGRPRVGIGVNIGPRYYPRRYYAPRYYSYPQYYRSYGYSYPYYNNYGYYGNYGYYTTPSYGFYYGW